MFLNKTKNFDWNNFKPDGLGPKNLIILEWDKFCKVSLLHIYMFVYSFCADRKKKFQGVLMVPIWKFEFSRGGIWRASRSASAVTNEIILNQQI